MKSLKSNTNKILLIVSGVNENVSELKTSFSNKSETLSLKPSSNKNITPKNEFPIPKAQPIKGIFHEFHVDNLHSEPISSIIVLKDNRVATSSGDKAISISSFNFEMKKWHHDIKKNKTHDDVINCLCELPENKILSASNDGHMKIWNVTAKDIKLVKKLSHSKEVCYVLDLKHKKFASASRDQTIKIWSSLYPYINNNSSKWNCKCI